MIRFDEQTRESFNTAYEYALFLSDQYIESYDLGKFLRYCRDVLGLSLRAIARDLIGCSQATVARWAADHNVDFDQAHAQSRMKKQLEKLGFSNFFRYLKSRKNSTHESRALELRISLSTERRLYQEALSGQLT